MSERKIWKQQEDDILKKIYEDMGIKKWTDVAKMMKDDYDIDGRNGKQCRERYHNHLKGGIRKEKWTHAEEELLIQLHSQHGNRWAFLSRMIPGRTENCVKNMLYSRMRKSVRQLNKFSWEHYRKTLKLINVGFIYRLIEFTENSYKKEEANRSQQQNIALRLKNAILHLNLDEDTISEEQKLEIKELVEEIHQFKRVNQHFRGNRGIKQSRPRLAKQVNNDGDSDFKVSISIDESESQRQDRVKIQEEKVLDYKKQLKKGQTQKDQLLQQKDQLQHQAMKVQLTERNDTLPDASQRALMESIFMGRETPKISMARRDSVESNLSFMFTDKGLQYPIRMQHPFFNLTPTPLIFNRTGEDWTNAISSWKPHISND